MQPPKNASFPVQPNSIRGKIEHTPLESAIRRHFNALKNQSVEVPEWSEPGKPCILYFDPVTVAERIELDQYRDDYHARVLIMKARLPDGKPAFTLDDVAEMLGKSALEIMDFPVAEFLMWVARIKIRRENVKRQ